MAESRGQSILYALLGLNRAGSILYATLIVLGGLALVGYTDWLPRFRFSEADERLFRAARHGDLPGIERSLAEGATVSAAAPTDGKTALFRAAVFGHADAVRLLLERGADAGTHGYDGQSPIEVVQAARGEEKDPAAARALDAVADLLRNAGARP